MVFLKVCFWESVLFGLWYRIPRRFLILSRANFSCLQKCVSILHLSLWLPNLISLPRDAFLVDLGFFFFSQYSSKFWSSSCCCYSSLFCRILKATYRLLFASSHDWKWIEKWEWKKTVCLREEWTLCLVPQETGEECDMSDLASITDNSLNVGCLLSLSCVRQCSHSRLVTELYSPVLDMISQ